MTQSANDKKTSKALQGVSVRVLITSGVFILLLIVLLFITKKIVLGHYSAFDNSAFVLLANYTSPNITPCIVFLTFFGSTKFLLPAYIALILFFLFQKNNRRSFNIAAIGITSVSLLYIVKNIFKRHRPPHPLLANVQGFSYPSGHSFSSFTFCGILIYILWNSQASLMLKWTGTLFLFLFATLIALSRVYLHVHYASDVVAGFCLSFVWLTTCIYLLRRIQTREQ